MGLLYMQEIETPIGSIVAIADDSYLYLSEFADSSTLQLKFEFLETVMDSKIRIGTCQILEEFGAELRQYFKKELSKFSIPTKSFGTGFYKKVWNMLSEIDYGKTISYKHLAHKCNSPKGFRAVAQANSKNFHSIVIPCHRVINANGKLGGYSGGLNRKKFLLELESGV